MPQVAIAAAISIATSLASAAISYALTPSTEITGDRLKDLSVPRSNYGEPIPKVFGRARIAGNMIWANKIIEKTTKKKQGKGGGKTTTKTYSYFGDFALMFCQGPIVGISKIWVNSKLAYDKSAEASSTTRSNSDDWADKYLRIYRGTSTQSPDSLIQASVGSSDTPAYRNRVYLVFEGLPLEDSGNRFPQVSIEVITAGTVANPSAVALSSILSYICTSAGLTTGQIDTSLIALAEIDGYYQVDGFTIDKSKSPKQLLEQLQQAYFFHFTESEGKVKFFPYERPSVASIPKSHLATYEYGQARPDKNYEQERTADLELPQEISLRFIDPYLNFQSSVVRAKREGFSTGENNLELTFPLVFKRDSAQKLVEKLLYTTWLKRRTYRFTLPLKYLYLEAADVVTLRLETGSQQVQISTISLGANYLLDIEAVAYKDTVLTTVSEPDAPDAPTPNPVLVAGDTNLKVLDIPLIKDSDVDNGLYLAGDGTGSWKSASVFVSRNAGSSWEFAKNLEMPSLIGVCNTVLGNSGTVSVTLRSGELESVSPGDLANGENTALIGSEIVRFQTATLTSTLTYTLSGLVRGVRGTEAFISSHGASERFILLSDYIERVDGLSSDIGLALQFKAITGDQDLADVSPVNITPVGNSLKPYSVVNVAGTKDATGKIQITWQRRDRKAGESTTYDNLPLSEVAESYEVEVMNGGTVVRTLTSATPFVDYSVANQATDFGGVQTSVSVRIYQISALVGRGTVKSATLTPSLAYAIPSITGFTPTQARPGDPITIYGSGLTGATALTVGGVAMTGLTVTNDGQATATLGASTPVGVATVSLTTPGGTASPPTGFFVNQRVNPSIVESISATKTLLLTSEVWQFLTPVTSDRDVILPVSPTLGLNFWIVNQSVGTLGLVLKETSGGAAIVTLKNAGDKERAVQCFYDGTIWNVFVESYYG
jgi:hypothetical protein